MKSDNLINTAQYPANGATCEMECKLTQ